MSSTSFAPLAFPCTAQCAIPPSDRLALILWLLMAAVPLCGLSGAVVELLGMKHFHQQAASGTVDPMAGWRDFRRALPAVGVESYGHAHTAVQRHHHATVDATVVALDGGLSEGPWGGEGGVSAAAAATHMLALLGLALTLPLLRAPLRRDGGAVSPFAVGVRMKTLLLHGMARSLRSGRRLRVTLRRQRSGSGLCITAAGSVALLERSLQLFSA